MSRPVEGLHSLLPAMNSVRHAIDAIGPFLAQAFAQRTALAVGSDVSAEAQVLASFAQHTSLAAWLEREVEVFVRRRVLGADIVRCASVVDVVAVRLAALRSVCPELQECSTTLDATSASFALFLVTLLAEGGGGTHDTTFVSSILPASTMLLCFRSWEEASVPVADNGFRYSMNVSEPGPCSMKKRIGHVGAKLVAAWMKSMSTKRRSVSCVARLPPSILKLYTTWRQHNWRSPQLLASERRRHGKMNRADLALRSEALLDTSATATTPAQFAIAFDRLLHGPAPLGIIKSAAGTASRLTVVAARPASQPSRKNSVTATRRPLSKSKASAPPRARGNGGRKRRRDKESSSSDEESDDTDDDESSDSDPIADIIKKHTEARRRKPIP